MFLREDECANLRRSVVSEVILERDTGPARTEAHLQPDNTEGIRPSARECHKFVLPVDSYIYGPIVCPLINLRHDGRLGC